MANNLDLKELEVLFQIYLDTKSEELNRYISKEVEKYTIMLYMEVMANWEAYYRSYKPKVYVRTGTTERGISPTNVRREGAKFIASVEFDDGMMYKDTSIRYGSQKTYGHAYAMIDIGWEDRNLKPQKYRYAYWDGAGMTERAIREVRRKMPDWMDVEIVTRSNKWLGYERTSAYNDINRSYGSR